MNLNEAKAILRLYRPGTADVDDPQIAAALALANHEPELARDLEDHCARHQALRVTFRSITVPPGLKEQIISEQAARERRRYWRPRLALGVAAAALLLAALATLWFPRRPSDDTLAIYRQRMTRIASGVYGMDLATNDPAQIRVYLARNQAPSDYVLPVALQRVAVVGCAVEGWQKAKVSMICFRTGRPLPPNQASDLWLFVVDRSSMQDAPSVGETRFTAARGFSTAVWTQDGKVYLLGIAGDESAVRQLL